VIFLKSEGKKSQSCISDAKNDVTKRYHHKVKRVSYCKPNYSIGNITLVPVEVIFLLN
jgi:hypothetical protein